VRRPSPGTLRAMKRIVLVLGAVVLIAGALVVKRVQPAVALAVGAGYAARVTCSLVFHSGMDPEWVMRRYVSYDLGPAHSLVKVSVDREAGTVDAVAATEDRVIPGSETLGAAVARNLARLMAYKDEYEVARLYTDPSFMAQLNEEFEGDFKIKFNLAPPLTARRDPDTGLPVKREYGGWIRPVFNVLRKLKALRGTAFDIFGYTAERRLERQLIEDYESLTRTLIEGLTPENHSVAIELAELAWEIRGFGHVKEATIEKVKRREQELLAELHRRSAEVPAASSGAG